MSLAKNHNFVQALRFYGKHEMLRKRVQIGRFGGKWYRFHAFGSEELAKGFREERVAIGDAILGQNIECMRRSPGQLKSDSKPWILRWNRTATYLDYWGLG